MTTKFDRDTGLEPAGDGVFTGHIDPDWWIVKGPNGGHLAAVALRAMIMSVGNPQRSPRSLTVHYTRPPAEGPFMIEVTLEREGRSLSTVSARMRQDGKLVLVALGALSRPFAGMEFADLRMPGVPAPESLEQRPDRPEMPFLANFDFRWAVGVTDLDSGSADAPAETGAWMRLREPRLCDHVLAAQFMDAWAPAIFAKAVPTGGGVPTVDMTIHFREPLPLLDARPDDWYFGLFRTTAGREGFIEEDGWLWSRDGRLVAQSRQLALLLVG